MTEMIERVANAIEAVALKECSIGLSKLTSITMARAAIAAMREPTAAMKQCGWDAGWHGNIDGDHPCEEEAAANLYAHMVDVALGEQMPPSPRRY